MKKTSRSFASKTFSLLVMSLAFATHAYATRHERLIETWQPTNFNVTLKFDDQLAEITKARTEITVKTLKDSLAVVDLDFGELPIDGVWIDGNVAQFDKANGKLNVHLQKSANKGERFVIAIDYHGAPKDGLILTSDKDGKPSATGDN